MITQARVYDSFVIKLHNNEINLDHDPLKIMLCTNKYEPSRSHQYKSEITHEVTGVMYPPGGVLLTSVTWTSGTLNAADVWFPAPMDYAARYAVIYDSDPSTDATKPLIALIDFMRDQGPKTGGLTILWSTKGILTVDRFIVA